MSGRDDRVQAVCNKIIGPSLDNLKKLVIELAKRDTHTLFVAETGAGKELFWELFKAASPRTGKKLEVNCASFTNESLLESALFGHLRGAFTGALGAHEN